jgi:lipopolysaccharide transport system ATP-binding protein
MTKKEIDKRFDSIVEFSGVAKFLDMPVKHYSSGMTVRLAFAVAAHVETDILLVDEVLAVGDAEFQKKCLGKMDEVVKQEGRTIVFVSHDIRAIKSICQRLIILDKGKIIYDGNVDERVLIGF